MIFSRTELAVAWTGKARARAEGNRLRCLHRRPPAAATCAPSTTRTGDEFKFRVIGESAQRIHACAAPQGESRRALEWLWVQCRTWLDHRHTTRNHEYQSLINIYSMRSGRLGGARWCGRGQKLCSAPRARRLHVWPHRRRPAQQQPQQKVLIRKFNALIRSNRSSGACAQSAHKPRQA